MLKKGLRVIADNLSLYLWCNGVYYGLVALLMLLVFLSPGIQEGLVEILSGQFEEEGTLLGTVGAAYGSGSVPLAALYTFLVNFFVGTVVFLGLPSAIFPPLAAFLGAYRAVLWGIMFSPSLAELRQQMTWHSVTLLLEGQGYILAVFAGLAAFKGFLKPGKYEQENRLAGYMRGWREAAPLYLWVALVLAVAAVYEAITVTGMIKG